MKASESGVRGQPNLLREKYFHFPEAALHALSSWVTLVFLVFRKLHVVPGGPEKPMRVCLLPPSSIPVAVWDLFFFFFFPRRDFGDSEFNPGGKEGVKRQMKDGSGHVVKGMSPDKNKEIIFNEVSL